MPAHIEKWRQLIPAVVLPCTVLAQPLQWPSADDMERARQTHPFPTLERLNAQPSIAVPRLPSEDVPPKSIDIAAMADRKSVV